MTDETVATGPAATPTGQPAEVTSNEPAHFGDGADDAVDIAMGKIFDELTGDGSDDAPADKEPVAEAAENTDQPADEDAAETEGKGHTPQSIPAPNSWSAEDKAKWNAIPPELQQTIATREQQTHKQITEQGQFVSALRPVTDLLQQTPYARQNPTEVLTNLVKAQAYLDNDPIEGLKWLAGSYGVDLNQLAGVQQQTEDDGYIFQDPRVDQVSNQLRQTRQELEDARRQIQELGGFVQTQRQQEHQARANETSSAIDAAAAKLPYFADLSNEIADEVGFLKSKDPSAKPEVILERAYQRALNNSPTYRQKVEQEKQAKERAEAEKKISKAQRTAATNVRTQTGSGRQMADTWDDDQAWSSTYDAIANS